MNARPLSAICIGLTLLCACSEEPDVTLYVALDQEHSSRLIDRFEASSGMRVRARFDTEASKTVGLVSAIIEESNRPRCDVFWNNELAFTVRLAQEGHLAKYISTSAARIPTRFKDPQGYWTGFAARARILIVNREQISDPEQYPRSMWDLIDPKWRGRCGIALPLTGTTLTHFAALHQVLSEEDFQRFIDGLFENEVALLQSNGATMRQTASGKLAWAFTDTDDFHVAQIKGYPVAAVFPDQSIGQVGTMLIPNSVSMVAGAPHPENARRLIDWILSEETEAALAAAKSAQIPLRASVRGPRSESILCIGEFKEMNWDPATVAESMPAMATLFARRFGR